PVPVRRCRWVEPALRAHRMGSARGRPLHHRVAGPHEAVARKPPPAQGIADADRKQLSSIANREDPKVLAREIDWVHERQIRIVRREGRDTAGRAPTAFEAAKERWDAVEDVVCATGPEVDVLVSRVGLELA